MVLHVIIIHISLNRFCICRFICISNTRICAFCDDKIAKDSESLCDSCKEKYSIGGYDLSKEGCGCDN
jgi:hypothetical protein